MIIQSLGSTGYLASFYSPIAHSITHPYHASVRSVAPNVFLVTTPEELFYLGQQPTFEKTCTCKPGPIH